MNAIHHQPANHPIHQRYLPGIIGQQFIVPMIQDHIQEVVELNTSQYDTMDASSPSYWIEIKRRSEKYCWSDIFMVEEGWLIPAVKILRCYCETKQSRFYYYWDQDQSLWYWDFDEEEIKNCICKTPPWHDDYQPHYYIKHEYWKRVL